MTLTHTVHHYKTTSRYEGKRKQCTKANKRTIKFSGRFPQAAIHVQVRRGIAIVNELLVGLVLAIFTRYVRKLVDLLGAMKEIFSVFR